MISDDARGAVEAKPLRVGIVVDGPTPPRWIAELATALEAAPHVDLAVVIVSRPSPRRPGLLIRLFDALEQRCVAMAQRMSMLYGLAAPEFFDRAMFRDFIDLLQTRNVIRLDAGGRLTYDAALTAVADDARIVLSEQIRNSILQVTHS